MAIVELNIPDTLYTAVEQACINNKIGFNELVIANLMLYANARKNDNKDYSYDVVNNVLKDETNNVVHMTKSELKIINCLYTQIDQFISVEDLAAVVYLDNGSKGNKPSIYNVRNMIASIKRKTNHKYILSKNGFGYKLNTNKVGVENGK